MNKIIIALIASIVHLFSGCMYLNLQHKYSQGENCSTSIEGQFTRVPVYKYYGPMILFQDSVRPISSYARVLSFDSLGVTSATKAVGLFGKSDTIFYEYSKIRAIIDDNRYCIWGQLRTNEVEKKPSTIPELCLYKIGADNKKPVRIGLLPNSSFSYCIDPGDYIIAKIIEGDIEEEHFETVPDVLFRVHIKRNCANYIGHLSFVSKENVSKETIQIPFKLGISEVQFLAGYNPIVTAVGAVFTLAQILYNEKKTAITCLGYYNLNLSQDSSYISKSSLTTQYTPLKLFRE